MQSSLVLPPSLLPGSVLGSITGDEECMAVWCDIVTATALDALSTAYQDKDTVWKVTSFEHISACKDIVCDASDEQ